MTKVKFFFVKKCNLTVKKLYILNFKLLVTSLFDQSRLAREKGKENMGGVQCSVFSLFPLALALVLAKFEKTARAPALRSQASARERLAVCIIRWRAAKPARSALVLAKFEKAARARALRSRPSAREQLVSGSRASGTEHCLSLLAP